LPKTDKQAADEVIAGTAKDPTRLSELTDADPEVDTDESPGAGAPAMADAT
jgi:hypothetical protein